LGGKVPWVVLSVIVAVVEVVFAGWLQAAKARLQAAIIKPERFFLVAFILAKLII
jgi:uncharacterized membrane protein